MFAAIFDQSTELLTGIVRPTSVARPVGRATGQSRSIISARIWTGLRRPMVRDVPIYTRLINCLKRNTAQNRDADPLWADRWNSHRRDPCRPVDSTSTRTYVSSRWRGTAMDRLKLGYFVLVGGAMLAATCAVRANDSAAELSIGGLQFVRTNDIAMESEDLRISLDRVSVH